LVKPGRKLERFLGNCAARRELEILEGNALPDHIHMVLSIPPKYSVVMVVGYLKGKSAIQIHREMLGVKKGFTGKSFWSRGTVLVRLDSMRKRFGSM